MAHKSALNEEAWLKEFSRRVNARMEYLEISQSELARRTGMEVGTIHNICHGYHTPLVTNVVKIARALFMRPSELIDFYLA